jgi:hypothetical protein
MVGRACRISLRSFSERSRRSEKKGYQAVGQLGSSLAPHTQENTDMHTYSAHNDHCRCNDWRTLQRAEGKAWSRSRLGRSGDGARELLPWTAGPGEQKNFDPEHPLARDSKGRSLALVLYSIQFVACPSSLALCISHPLQIPRCPQCLRARVNVFECRGCKRSKVSPRGALNLPAARFLQTKRFDPLSSPPLFHVVSVGP